MTETVINIPSRCMGIPLQVCILHQQCNVMEKEVVNMLEVTEKALKKLVEFKGNNKQPVRLNKIMSGCG